MSTNETALPGTPDPDDLATMAAAPVIEAATRIVERWQAWKHARVGAPAEPGDLDALENALCDFFRVWDALTPSDDGEAPR